MHVVYVTSSKQTNTTTGVTRMQPRRLQLLKCAVGKERLQPLPFLTL